MPGWGINCIPGGGIGINCVGPEGGGIGIHPGGGIADIPGGRGVPGGPIHPVGPGYGPLEGGENARGSINRLDRGHWAVN